MRNKNFCTKVFRLLTLVLLLFTAQFVCAQEGGGGNVKGRIVDANSGDPLIGVNISIQGTTTGTTSDLNGEFQLKVNSGTAVVVFSYVGYTTIEMSAAEVAKRTLFEMSEEANALDEVVVVGYGVQKKASSVGSITQTKGEDLMKGGSLNSVSEALQGRLNGVVMINTSGQPGDSGSSNMYIRGKSTWGNTSPLVLVDGIERDMDDIDMNEIEAISVLKDASATAVYGVRGGNGVILITTKRGSNQGPTVSLSANVSFKRPTTDTYLADHVTAMQAYNSAMANDQSWDKMIPQTTITAWQRAYREGLVGPYSDVFPYVNWRDELIDTGYTQNYNVNIRGGSDFLSYFASVGYQGDGDIYNGKKNADFDPRYTYSRYNWRSNLDFRFTPSTKLSVSIAGKMGYRNTAYGSDPFTRMLSEATSDHPIKYSDGYWGDDEEKNPVANMNMMGSNQYKTFQGWYDAALEQKLDFITPGLKVAGKISYSSSSTTATNIRRGAGSDDQAIKSIIRYHRVYDYANPVYAEDGSIFYPMIENTRLPNENSVPLPPGVNNYDALNNYTRRLYYEFSVSYDRSFNDHNVSLLALVNRQINDSKDGSNIVFPSYREDWVGRATYNWKERYLAEVNISYTGSEKFARGNRFGLFPSFSAGWRLSEEPFIKRSVGRVLTNAKIRYSWGKVGSDAGAQRWNYIQTYTSGGNITLGSSMNQEWGPIYSEGAIANTGATWEKSTKQNLGIEFGLWNKFSAIVDFFDEQRKDILMTPNTTSSIVGASFNAVNRGETKNHGFEIELRWNDKIGKDFHYYVEFTMASSENRVVFRDDPRNTPDHLRQAGKPIGLQNRYIAIGNYESIDDVFNHAQSGSINAVNPNQVVPGDFVYVDFDSNGILNDLDKVVNKELNYPLRTYGVQLGFDWKGLGFSAMLYAPTGVYKLLDNNFYASFIRGNINAQPYVTEVWTPETANKSGVMWPSLHLKNSDGFNGTESTFRYRDFSYLRLKNVEIHYQFPKRWLKAAHISNLQVYLNGTNLLTFWDGDDRIDPEGNQVNYPVLRTVTAGVRLSF